MGSLQALLDHGKTALIAALDLDPASARIETQMLLQHALGVSRAYVLAHPEHCPDPTQLSAFQSLLARRLEGEPVAYLLGSREFFGLELSVGPATLIPRPDTELLVELALQTLPPPGTSARVLDLGTGTGAIALAIAQSRPDADVSAIEAVPEALQLARANARRLGLERVRLLQGDWFSPVSGERFDLIVSNPPYIAAGDPHLQQGDVRFEPSSALVSGPDGLDAIRHIVRTAPDFMYAGAALWLEHGYDQAAAVRRLLQAAGFDAVRSERDLAGIERASGGRLSGQPSR